MDNASEWKELTNPEITRMNQGLSLMGKKLLSDYDIFIDYFGYTPGEAEKAVARMKHQKLEDLKIQIIANNPSGLFVRLPEVGEDEEDLSAEKEDPNQCWTYKKGYFSKVSQDDRIKGEEDKKASADYWPGDALKKKSVDPLYETDWKEAKKCEPKQMGVTGVMTFYFNVGSLAPARAEAFVEKYKEKLNKDGFLDRLKAQSIEVLFMPVRPPQESCVEYIKL